ncbi:MAG: hypothetical protein HBSIN02_00990 [Bacteroidia bacterium]|nr:MAG: hypothetical protein HBSIN02_00990 [Bacteroidia bacterium]
MKNLNDAEKMMDGRMEGKWNYGRWKDKSLWREKKRPDGPGNGDDWDHHYSVEHNGEPGFS